MRYNYLRYNLTKIFVDIFIVDVYYDLLILLKLRVKVLTC